MSAKENKFKLIDLMLYIIDSHALYIVSKYDVI